MSALETWTVPLPGPAMYLLGALAVIAVALAVVKWRAVSPHAWHLLRGAHPGAAVAPARRPRLLHSMRLDPTAALHVVTWAGRCYLVGTSGAAAPAVLDSVQDGDGAAGVARAA